jgi:hypothetical protein
MRYCKPTYAGLSCQAWTNWSEGCTVLRIDLTVGCTTADPSLETTMTARKFQGFS